MNDRGRRGDAARAVGRSHEPGRHAGLEAARTSKARTPGEHTHPSASAGESLAEILRHSGDRTPGSCLVRRRSRSPLRREAGEARERSASKVMGVEVAVLRGRHGPGPKDPVTADGSVAGRFGRPRTVPPDVEGFQQRSARGASHEKCPEARRSPVSRDAPRGARCQREEGRLRPWRVNEDPRLGGSKALEGRERPGEHRPPRDG